MGSTSNLNGRAYSADALALLKALPSDSLPALSKYLMQRFSSRMVFATVFDGDRPDGGVPETVDDLNMLAGVLPQGLVNTDPTLRDFAGTEPSIIRTLRQLEGRPPALAGVLTPDSDHSAEEAVREALAIGFTFTDGPRQIGLLPMCPPQLVDQKEGEVRVFAGTSWDDLARFAAAEGLSLADQFPEIDPTPLAAAGASPHSSLTHKFGAPWSDTLTLPPQNVGRTERVWVFEDDAAAVEVFHDVRRRFRPTLIETVPTMDSAAGGALHLWRGHKRFRRPSATALRLAFTGPRIARRVALMESSWTIEKNGGVLFHRRSGLAEPVLNAAFLGNGAGRFVRSAQNEAQTSALPEHVQTGSRWIARHGIAKEERVTWYLRDLSDSVGQAQRLLATAAQTDDQEPSVGPPPSKSDGNSDREDQP